MKCLKQTVWNSGYTTLKISLFFAHRTLTYVLLLGKVKLHITKIPNTRLL